eukprot:TRINITY_DN5647_c0_g1_i1.p1 TRINITY_DN5647_c0_g1~~TRINITY_DN5647_c0_g1_i1.p1  ORF type:complete len:279 (-),score=84.96 TRINITY_DN5647_c0_g1_i1:60-896(-)
MRNFEAIPEIRAYHESAEFRNKPIFTPGAPYKFPVQEQRITPNPSIEGKVVIAYWMMQGRAEPIIKLAKYTKLPFEFKGYTNPADWQADKAVLKHLFPNVPYIKTGETVMCETDAIVIQVCALANREELLGRNNQELVQGAAVRGVVKDILNDLFGLYFNPNWQTEQAKVLEKCAGRLKRLEKFAAGKKFILGNDLVLADFFLYQILYFLSKMGETILSPYPNLLNFMRNFEAIPEIRAYHESDEFRNKPIFTPGAPYKFPVQEQRVAKTSSSCCNLS